MPAASEGTGSRSKNQSQSCHIQLNISVAHINTIVWAIIEKTPSTISVMPNLYGQKQDIMKKMGWINKIFLDKLRHCFRHFEPVLTSHLL